MKLVALILAVTAANALHLADAGSKISVFEDPITVFTKSSPYDRCLHYIEDINHVAVDLIKLILDKQFDRIAPKVLKLASLVQLAVDCFIHPSNVKQFVGIDPQCAIDHLRKAGMLVREIIHDVLHQRWHDIPEHFNQMIAILEDIRNC